MRLFLLSTLITLTAHFSLLGDDKKVDEDYAKKLVGKWSPKKDAGKRLVEFTKDGKLRVITTIDEKKSVLEGTYKVEGKKLILTVKVGEKVVEQTRTIFDVTDSELITTDEQGKKEFSDRVKNK